MITISRIIPSVRRALQSHSPQDSQQLKSKKDPAEEVIVLSQAACSVILCNYVSISPRSINPEIAGGVGHGRGISLLS